MDDEMGDKNVSVRILKTNFSVFLTNDVVIQFDCLIIAITETRGRWKTDQGYF